MVRYHCVVHRPIRGLDSRDVMVDFVLDVVVAE